MREHTTFDLEAEMVRVLQKKGRDYLALRDMVAGLPAAVRRQIGMHRQGTATEHLTTLAPYLKTHLQAYHGARSIYIGYPLSASELLLKKIAQVGPISTKRLAAQLLLLKKVTYLTTLNTLLAQGALLCRITDDHRVMLHLAEASPAAPTELAEPVTEPAEPVDERTAFWQAYQTVGKGRNFVDISRVRAILPWDHQRFDRVLGALRDDYTIELHGGDPSVMTADDIRQSFLDARGTLYLTLSWRGRTP